MNSSLPMRFVFSFTLGLFSIIMGILAPLALAHGGEEVLLREFGPYYVVVNKSIEESEGQPHLEYTIYLRDAEQRRPVSANRASIQVSAETPGGAIGPIDAEEFSNQYYVYEPIEQGGTWTMNVAIQGELGEASFSHEIQLPQDHWYDVITEASLPVLAGGGVVALSLVGGLLYWRVSRRRA